MTDAMAHRGPDGEGLWTDPRHGVHFGHRRLAILDVAGGSQPMTTTCGNVVVTFNGEIYNFAELRAELTALGHVFQTASSDTEVLLHGWKQWGPGLQARLNGMWAFVLYDRTRRLIFASRDRFGKKPLYYALRSGTFVFGSELSVLRRHPRVLADLKDSNLARKKYYAYGYIPSPHTTFERVWKLPAGHCLSFPVDAPSQLRVERYWSYRAEPLQITPNDPIKTWGEELRHLLGRAVARRRVADVPVGVFLSGGVDSSAITALAATQTAGAPLETFSVGFEEPSFDESAFSRQVADLFGTCHHEQRLSIERARELLPEITRRLDEPMGDASLLPTYLLCEFTRQRVKVALSGDGGDELFAGYDPFQALRLAKLYASIVPRPVHRAISALAGRLPVSHRNMSLDFKIKRTLRGMNHPSKLWLPIWMAPLAPDQLDAYFGEPTDLEDVYSEAIAAWETCASRDLVDRTTQFYVELYLQSDILTKVDRASMMHGLEARAPFLDIDVVDFVRRIPSAWKLHRGRTKYLLKEALRPLLPSSILDRKKKGFGVPIGRWFHDGSLTLDASSTANPRFTHAALAEHKAGQTDHRAFLWNTWVESHLRRAT